MPRYRKSSRKLSELDPESPEYWSEVLKREGLNMTRGLYPQKLVYVGSSFDVTKISDAEGVNDEDCPYEERIRDDARMVRPTGAKPE